MNPMRSIGVEKVTVNMGIGAPGEEMEKGRKILKLCTGAKVVTQKARARLPKWGVRPGLEIGLKTTMRGQPALDFLKRAFEAKDNTLSRRCFDRQGNFGLGIHEHIDLPGIKYDPELGIMGMDVLVTLTRPGYRVKKRKQKKARVGKKHVITPLEAASFVQEFFGVKVEE